MFTMRHANKPLIKLFTKLLNSLRFIKCLFSGKRALVLIIYLSTWRLPHCFLSLGLLLLFGAYLAWETRKVHIPALNDSKLIGSSVYNVIIPCILVFPILGVVADRPTIHFSLSSFLTIFCTSFTLSLVFVPKVSLSKKFWELSFKLCHDYVCFFSHFVQMIKAFYQKYI